MIKRIILLLILNFSALAIGGVFTRKGVPSDWYQNLIKRHGLHLDGCLAVPEQ